jgi:hypothetical protein
MEQSGRREGRASADDEPIIQRTSLGISTSRIFQNKQQVYLANLEDTGSRS